MAIQYTLTGDAKAIFVTYDLYGRKVNEMEISSGTQVVEISNAAGGVSSTSVKTDRGSN